jgi:hypothetical protein
MYFPNELRPADWAEWGVGRPAWPVPKLARSVSSGAGRDLGEACRRQASGLVGLRLGQAGSAGAALPFFLFFFSSRPCDDPK